MPSTLAFTPRSDGYRVRWSKPQEMSEGGIILPECAQHPPEEAEVLAAGPGLWLPLLENWASMQVGVGDRVIFFKADLKAVDEHEGALSDSHLIGVVDPETGEIEPLGDWVKVESPQRIAALGSVAVPEKYRRRERRGRVLAVGPGQVRTNPRSPLYGTRAGCHAICSLPEDESLVGAVVWWNPDSRIADVLQPSGEPCMFVKANELLFVEE